MAMDDDAGVSRGAGVDSFGSTPAAVPTPAPPPSLSQPSAQAAPAEGGAPTQPVVAPAPLRPVVPPPPPPPPEVQAPDAAVKAYIERCLRPQQLWFSRKAAKCKRAHYAVITAQIVATTSIPLLNMLILGDRRFAYLSTAAAAVSGLAAGVASFGKFKEHWLRYRENATILENLQLEYELSLPPFNGPGRNNLLIDTVRKILSEEQKLWMADVKSGSVAKTSPGAGSTPSPMPARAGSSSDDDS